MYSENCYFRWVVGVGPNNPFVSPVWAQIITALKMVIPPSVLCWCVIKFITMATTLIARPQILSSSTAKLYSIFCHSTRRLVAPTSVLLRRRSNRLQTSLSGSGKSSDPVSSRSGFGRRQLFTKATNVNDAGSIDSPLMQSMEIKVSILPSRPSAFT